MSHEHKTKIVDWTFDEAHNFIPSLYGCTVCDETFVDLPLEKESLGHTHTTYVDGCFACKAKTLQLSTGDANSTLAMSGKKWDSENQFYADAVKQGVNPDGVFRHEVEAALEASETLGVAYDGDTMMPAKDITPKLAQTLKDIGDI